MNFIPRPLTSYATAGDQAQASGHAMLNPHAPGSLAWLQWRCGYQRAALDLLKIQRDDLNSDGALDEIDLQITDARLELRESEVQIATLLFEMNQALPDAASTAATIGVALEEWPGRCATIAHLLHQSGLLKPFEARFGQLYERYGIYSGQIARTDSLFSGRQSARHAWLESFNGHVVDPTLWVFTAAAPHVAARTIDQYDFGAIRTATPPNAVPPDACTHLNKTFPLPRLHKDTFAFLQKFLRDPTLSQRQNLTLEQAFWLGRQDLESLGLHAPAIYAAIAAFNPSILQIDLRKYVQDQVAAMVLEATTDLPMPG